MLTKIGFTKIYLTTTDSVVLTRGRHSGWPEPGHRAAGAELKLEINRPAGVGLIINEI